jgi:hypothetical protein
VKGGEEFEAAELPWFLTLHWAWLLVAEGVALALRIRFEWTRWPSVDVLLMWSFLQAGWLSRVDQRSTTLYWYVADLVLGYAAASETVRDKFPALVLMLPIAIAVITVVGLFHFRRDMERYFKCTDDLDLHLSPWMIFSFNTLYFQYKFGEVSRLRLANPLRITPTIG